jgi:hypothetical protein
MTAPLGPLMAKPDDLAREVPGRASALPVITDEMRANARANPNTWLYVIDEAFDPNGRVPPWAVVGAYPVNADGDVVEDFHPNDQYRPSPKALGFPEPANELERALQLVRTGHRPAEDLPAVVLRSTLHVYAFSPEQRNDLIIFGPCQCDLAECRVGYRHQRATGIAGLRPDAKIEIRHFGAQCLAPERTRGDNCHCQKQSDRETMMEKDYRAKTAIAKVLAPRVGKIPINPVVELWTHPHFEED